MPVEIRELIIKTEIVSRGKSKTHPPADINMADIRKQVMVECKRILGDAGKKKNNNR